MPKKNDVKREQQKLMLTPHARGVLARNKEQTGESISDAVEKLVLEVLEPELAAAEEVNDG